jgi:CheY-like chemotaxis protein
MTTANETQVLSTFLRKIGCTFETASDGLSALQQYKETNGKFDYILMGMHTSNPSSG